MPSIPMNTHRTEYERPDIKNAMEHFEKDRAAKEANGGKDVISSSEVSLKFTDSLRIYCKTIQCQDPTNPIKGEKLSQMYGSMVQTQASVAMKEKMEELYRQQAAGQMMQAASQIDNLVKVNANTFNYDQREPCEIGFFSPPEAKKASMVIMNMNNDTVKIIDADLNPGVDGYTGVIWEGVDSKGEKVAPGQYRFMVTLLDEKDELLRDKRGVPLETQTTVMAQVTGGRMNHGSPYIRMSGQDYPMDKIVGVDSTRVLKEYIRNKEIADMAAAQAAAQAAAEGPQVAAATPESNSVSGIHNVSATQEPAVIAPDNGLVTIAEDTMNALQAAADQTL